AFFCTIFILRTSLACPTNTRDLHSFPTRRSSDLRAEGVHALRRLFGRDALLLHERNELAKRIAAGRDREVHQVERFGAEDRLQRSEEHTSELQSRENLVCRLRLEKKN